ncbi:MAG: hypothetical protein M3P41_12775 [Actinomycetota bacterium]|nr:hypothetical protein [Actinomycetota bacterium]
MEIVVPRWSSWSFLVYAGGLTVLASALGWLSYLSGRHGDAAFTAWALVVAVLLEGTAHLFLRRGHRLAAGVFAFSGVVGFAVFVGALFTWFGWLGHQSSSSTFRGFDTARLALELLTVAAAVATLRTFRHPLLMLPVVLVAWLFVTDLLSGGGGWSATVTLVVGLVFLAWALGVDAGPRRPYGFWLHVAAGLTIGGSLLYFWHSGNADWVLVVVASLVYVRLAGALDRSSWAVLGTLGLLIASVHFALEWTSVRIPFFGAAGSSSRGWVPPLVFAVTGLLLVALGLATGRRQRVAA